MRIPAMALVAAGLVAAVGPGAVRAQELAPDDGRAQLVVPQIPTVRHPGRRAPVRVESVAVHVSTLGPAATTTLDVTVCNPGDAMAEAELLLPLPRGATVGHFDFHGAAAEPTARLLRREEARRTYEDIVRRLKDPALLEFAGSDLLRSSVFPVPAHGTQRVRVRYDHVLAVEGNRTDLVVPRSETAAGVPWTLTADLRANVPLAGAYSPSHAVTTTRMDGSHLRVEMTGGADVQPGPFRLSLLAEGEGTPASLFACPDGKGGGWFLFFAQTPQRDDDAPAVAREVTLVLDRSGSMRGGKLDQAREAALQVLAGLGGADRFRIVDYADTVSTLSGESLPCDGTTLARARAWLAALRPSGGTNLHGALREALSAPATGGALPLVLFLTDGVATVGPTAETDIVDLVRHANTARRRVFPFGVGVDVNAPLLDGLALESGGSPTFVLPGENVEVAVGRVARRLGEPVLSDPRFFVPSSASVLLRDVLPRRLPDLFAGDPLVVLGRYQGEGTLRVTLSGRSGAGSRMETFAFDLARASTGNTFVPRLWASRRIGELSDALRQAGADPALAADPDALRRDPLHRERIEEIVALSREFGVLSEYTAFLATEGTDLSDGAALVARTGDNYRSRALNSRTGAAGVNQSLNAAQQRGQTVLNTSNTYVDANLREVNVSGVAQVADGAAYRRGGDWVDGRVLARGAGVRPERTVTFGSEAHLALVRELADDGRQALAALRGGVVLEHRGHVVRVEGPSTVPSTTPPPVGR